MKKTRIVAIIAWLLAGCGEMDQIRLGTHNHERKSWGGYLLNDSTWVNFTNYKDGCRDSSANWIPRAGSAEYWDTMQAIQMAPIAKVGGLNDGAQKEFEAKSYLLKGEK